MGPQDLRRLFEAYVESLDTAYFADDAVLTLVPLAQEFTGREAITGAWNGCLLSVFTYAWIEVRTCALDADNGVAVAEFVFKARHNGELFGIPASGRSVEVPVLGIFELASAKIQRARLYYDHAGLLRQLGAGR